MKDLFLHDSLDTSPVVFSDRILYTPTDLQRSRIGVASVWVPAVQRWRC